MSGHNLLMDPETIQSNRNGQFTKDQYSSLKTRFGGVSGWFTIGMMAALLVLAYFLAGKTLVQSTPLAIMALVVVILVSFAITSFLGGILARPKMANISVEHLAGQVVWNNNQYTAVAGGRTLEPITASLNLQPGDYTFYLLRGTNILLSAQPAGGAEGIAGGAQTAAPMDLASFKALLDQPLDFDPKAEPDKAAQHLAQMKQAFENLEASGAGSMSREEATGLMERMVGQTGALLRGQSFQSLVQLGRQMEAVPQPKLDKDGVVQLTSALDQVGVRNASTLNANQAGKQSAGQRTELIKGISSNLVWVALFGVGWLASCYFFLRRGDWNGVLVITAFLSLIGLALLSSVRREVFDLMSGSVQLEEGRVTKFSRSQQMQHSSSIHYYYQVNQNTLEVSSQAYNALIEGNYRVYYLPNTHKLVNIDPLPAF